MVVMLNCKWCHGGNDNDFHDKLIVKLNELQGAAKKWTPKVCRCFLKNRLEF